MLFHHAPDGGFKPSSPNVRFFAAPPAGRRILSVFSYIQKIGKGGQTQVWFPDDWGGQKVEWAAVRQYEILQESGNFYIEELELTELKRCMTSVMKMRAGGYRVTVITLGDYAARTDWDDLQILDQRIQEEITKLIHFLYLNEQSEVQSAQFSSKIDEKSWSFAEDLPHVAMALGEKRLFKPHKQSLAEQTFFEILERLPHRHIMHDVAVGLQLPDATKDKIWVYCAKGEHTPTAFFGALASTIGTTINHQMRAHGDRLKPKETRWQQDAVRALRAA